MSSLDVLIVAVTFRSTSPSFGDGISLVPSSTGFPFSLTRTAFCVLAILMLAMDQYCEAIVAILWSIAC